MNWNDFRLKLRALFLRKHADRDLEEELALHLEMETRKNLALGMDPPEARRRALMKFGGVVRVTEECRDARGINLIDGIIQDIRYGLRTLRKNPGFTVAVVAMLALGIGVNAAVFTIVKSALFEGFPVVDRNDRLVYMSTNKDRVSGADLEDWRAKARSFVGMAPVLTRFNILGDDGNAPETYFTAEVTADTFQLVGVKPILGRDFSPSDYRSGAEPVVILRYGLWVRRFGMNPAIIGQTVRIGGSPTRVIGVMPQGFSFPADQDLWTPLMPRPIAPREAGNDFYGYVFARMAEGVTIEHARAEMETIGKRLESAYPASNRGVEPELSTFEEWYIGADAATLFKTMWGAVGLVLLIICGNVANLSLARATGRTHENSIRLALGAGRWPIIRQFFVETLILTILGGAIGWWIAKAALRIYVYAMAQVSIDVVRVLGYTMDYRVLAYLIAISICTGLLIGFATVSRLTTFDINRTLKDDSRGLTGGKHGRRLSNILVAAEMVLAVVLLASAGVVVRSFLNVYTADVGVNAANVLSVSVNAPPVRYPTTEAQISFYDNVKRNLEAIPGVVSVGFASTPPLGVARPVAYELADNPAIEEQSRPTVGALSVSRDYFKTVGARVIRGREFDFTDRAATMPVAIVNELFANQNWPGQSPLGKRFRYFRGQEPTPWVTIVGVVSNIVQGDRTRQRFDPLIYTPGAGGFALLQTSVAPGSLATGVRRELYAMEPSMPLPVLWPLAERFDRLYSFEKNMTVLLLVFAVVALFVASIGLYATISHSMSKRAQEIGIRVAVGATRRDILKLVFKQGLPPVGIGLTIGFAVSFAVTRVLEAQLVGVSPADPVALGAATAVLVLCAALGCWIPARRAMRVDPVIALRHD